MKTGKSGEKKEESISMFRKMKFVLAGAVLGAVSVAGAHSFAASAVSNSGDDNAQTYRSLALFGDVFERVREQYVTKPDDKKMVENALNGMLSSLDPHSSYMDAKGCRDLGETTKGEFGGLGLEVTADKGAIKVISPIDDTPAAKAGVMAGDLIVKIDGKDIGNMTLNDAVNKMRGKEGTEIKLTLIRKNAAKPIEMTLKRAIIKVKAVKWRVENGDVGFLRITQFTGRTYDDLADGIAKIRAQVPDDKLKGYIIDLRLNPGGLLNQAVAVSDAFLNKGEVVSIRGRDPKDVIRYDAHQGDLTHGKPIIVMINGGSASAAEILAGALQDQRRATVLGTQSFGKGSVQTIVPLGDDNGCLRLTTALYYTPAGRSIQGTGITPDINVTEPLPKDLQGYDVNAGESELQGHIKGKNETNKGSGSSVYVPLDPKADAQLQDAVKLIEGKEKNPAFPPDPNKDVLKAAIITPVATAAADNGKAANDNEKPAKQDKAGAKAKAK